ncbi:MAG: hydrogenase maturation protease [Chitinivibrionales bacterium]|nr:hydrogenase maturation protease [Chitinivibrionales bacterium]
MRSNSTSLHPDKKNTPLGIIGIGNTLVGDDAAGVIAVRRLQERLGRRNDIFFHILSGDIYEIADLLEKAGRFVFLDALAGAKPGHIRIVKKASRAFAPSLHQTDIASVMETLRKLDIVSPFPEWEIWGVTIEIPEYLGEGLSPVIDSAVDELVERLVEKLR